MKKMSIASAMGDVLKNTSQATVWYGATDLIDLCAEKAGMEACHPLDRATRVLNALEKSPLFEKGYISADIGGRRRKFRCFTLRE